MGPKRMSGLLIPKKSAQPSQALQRASQNHRRSLGSGSKAKRGSPSEKPKKYRAFKDITPHLLAAPPGTLELLPTISAPSAQHVKDQAVKDLEVDRLRHFGVPIKIYEQKWGKDADAPPDFTDDDRDELNVYGSRVIINEEGRVLALEVRKDLEHYTRSQAKHHEICECIEAQYEVGRRLKESQTVRRVFIAKILMLECILRMPGLLFIYAQFRVSPVHDFIYQQTVFMSAICLLLYASRIAAITCSKVGRYEPCRSVMAIITAASYGFNCALVNAGLEMYLILFVEINQYEDPISLAALKEKLEKHTVLTFPYVCAIINIHMLIYSSVLSLILVTQNKFMNEFSNAFLLVIFVMAIPMGALTTVIVNSSIPQENLWHTMHQIVGIVCGCKWSMFRFYALQRVLKGRVMPIDETLFVIVALTFAVAW